MKATEKNIATPSEIFFNTPSNLAKNTFLYITCCGHFYYDTNYSLTRNNYNSFLIMYVIKGSAKISCSGKSYIAKKDDIVYLNCYEPHGYEVIEELETLWFHFDGNAAKDYDNALQIHECVFTLSDTYRSLLYIKKILESFQNDSLINEALHSAYITSVLAELFPSIQQSSTGNSKELSLVEETISYINTHITEKLNIETLAKNVSLSPFYFAHNFKKESGFTPHEYVTKARINKAKALLKSTDLAIKEIAFICGFSNESCFTNTFKKNVGITPCIFRNTVV